ncbi:hypothetical protein K493DRAFT_320213, partial [Basidiobolus meristosporus CBS 931.73]
MKIPVALLLFALICGVVNSIPIDISTAAVPLTGSVGASLSLLGNNEIAAMDVVMVVPLKPSTNAGSFFAWAGIQPSEGSQFLRSSLSYNPSCNAAGNSALETPTVASEYIDGSMTCQRTNPLSVSPGQEIYIQFRKSNSVWSVYATNMATSETSTISMDLQNVPQRIASLGLQIPDGMVASGDVIFKNWVIQSLLPDPNLCQNMQFSRNTICSASQVYEGNLQCALTNCVVKL